MAQASRRTPCGLTRTRESSTWIDRSRRLERVLKLLHRHTRRTNQGTGRDFTVKGYRQNRRVADLNQDHRTADLPLSSPTCSDERPHRTFVRDHRQRYYATFTSTSRTSTANGRLLALRAARHPWIASRTFSIASLSTGVFYFRAALEERTSRCTITRS
jgi:hypothetical protein